MCRTAAAIFLLAALGSGTAQAWSDDSHGYRGIRKHPYGPLHGSGYFSGVKVRVDDWRTPHRHDIWRHRLTRYLQRPRH